jgi:excisionase family DNA binding protein
MRRLISLRYLDIFSLMTAEKPLFVRLPAAEADKLDRASHELRVAKKDLVTALVARAEFDGMRRVVVDVGHDELTVGRADFRPHPSPEVLTLAQAAELLQLDPAAVADLAAAGELPGRKIGDEWRFSRAAVLAWLGG